MSNFVVSARKYRPKRFSEVVGQDHIVTTLTSALVADKLPHAFLFCGPRGVGKTTCARILARSLNCQNLQGGTDPCGECESCLAFARNASFNIFELDAASYNGVDNIRLLNEQVRVPPSEGKYKVYIIDEVHMLSSGAFNAFLKTLEEPPPYAIFILATTEKHKILPTILSRCQIFDFRRIQVKDMASHLQKIAETESIQAEYDALITISEKADGALRDALSLFDRISSVSSKNITYQTVVDNLNLLDYDVFFKTADACLREDIREVLILFDSIIRSGFEGDIFLDGLAQHYRDLLVCKHPETLQLQDHSDTLKKRYQEQAGLMPSAYIFSALNIINEADVQLPRVRNKRLHVEMALARICFMNREVTVSPFVPEKKTVDESSTVATTSKPTIAHAGPPQQSSPEKTPPEPDVQPEPVEKHENGAAEETILNPSPDAEKETARPMAERKPITTKIPRPDLEAGSVPKANDQFRRVKSAIPQLKSLTELESEIKEEEQLVKENSRELTTDNLVSWWQETQEKVNSPSIASALKSTKIRLEDLVVRIEVQSQVARARVQEMNTLLADLRRTFDNSDLQLQVDVNSPDDPDESQKPRKLLTNKEKYELLTSKNPNVEDLRQSLDLIVDHDE